MIDGMYIFIVFMFILIFVFDRLDSKEGFYGSSINLGNQQGSFAKLRNFSNFTGYDEVPHRRLVPNCYLKFGCHDRSSDHRFMSDKHTSVCTRCRESNGEYLKLHNGTQFAGWRAGRTRGR